MQLIKNFSKKYNFLTPPVKAALWFTICNMLKQGITVITTPIWTRLFSVESFGIYNIFKSWMGILSVFVTFRLSAGVYTRGLLKFEDKQDDFTSSIFGLLTFITIIFSFIYFPFRNFWNEILGLSTILMVCMFSLMWTDTIFSVWAAREQFNYKYKKLLLITIVFSIINPISGIISVIVFPQQEVEARIVSMTIIEVLFYLPILIIQLIHSKQIFDYKVWKYAILFNLPLIPHYLSQTVLSSSDRIMIGKMTNEHDAGIYGLAYSVATLCLLINTSIEQAFNPWLYKNIKNKSLEKVGHASYIILALVATINLLFICFAPEAIKIFAPKEYYEAVWIVPPVSMSVFFMFMYCLFADFEFYFEKTWLIMFASVIGAILNILLNLIFIPIYGYIAAGYTTLICYILYSSFHYFFMRKIVKENLSNIKIYNMKIILLISCIFMGIGFVIMPTYLYPIIRYTILALALIILFICRKKIKNILSQVFEIKNGKIVLR